MKIGLINPQGKTTCDNNFNNFLTEHKEIRSYVDSLNNAINPGLLVIAALTPKKYQVELIDENQREIDFSKKYDLIAISAMTQQATRAYYIADKFRVRGTKVVIGGIHATVLPDEAKEHCDSVFVGEAEETWPIFLNDYSKGIFKSVYKAEKLFDMNKAPIPRYDLLKKDINKTVWVQTSRGCPRDCEFCCCSRFYGFKPRQKSIRRIVAEIKTIQKYWPNTRIDFSDDNLLVDRTYARKLIRAVKKLKIRWYAQSDVSIYKDTELLKEMRLSGCTSIFIGFESISMKSLESINKNSWKAKQLENYATAIETIQSNGIGVVGAFIVGLDGDTLDTFDDLADFIIKTKLFTSQIAILTPLPGTRIHERYKMEHRLLDTDWENYTFTDVNYLPKNMNKEELQAGFYKIYKKVYNKDTRLEVLKELKNKFARLLYS